MGEQFAKRENRLARRISELRASLRQREPYVLARNTGATLESNQLDMQLWGTDVIISLPDFVAQNAQSGKMLDLLDQAIIAYYLITADGTQPAGNWVSFTDLPAGRFYTQAFQGYTGRELVQVFGNQEEAFIQAALLSGGQPYSFGEVAFRFQALPFVPLLVVCWLGDEEMAPSYRFLFDAHVPHHLPTDGCAILGSRLTQMLLRNKEEN